MKRLKSAITKTLSGILLAGLLTSCEPTNSNNKERDNANNGQGRENFDLYVNGGHMFNGETAELTGEVIPGANYQAKLYCSNDGGRDLITILAAGRKIGEYLTEENSMGGRGWYEDQIAGPYSFTTISNTINFKIYTKTDEWGTWPQVLEVKKVE